MSGDLYQNKYRIPSARAEWHSYNVGYYFITICTHRREHFFGEIYNHQMNFSILGRRAKSLIEEINIFYPDANVLSFVVMPNHIHLIISVDKGWKRKNTNQEADREVNEIMQDISNQCGRLSIIISRFKSMLTRFARDNDIYFAWQSRFYDRIIRDHHELERECCYVENNVYNWEDDELYPTEIP